MAIPGLSAVESALNIKAEEGDYLVLGMTGHEHLGQMFEYTVELAAIPPGLLDVLGPPKKIDLGKLIGTPACLHMKVMEEERWFHGHVTRAKRGEKKGRYETYTLTLQPWIWFMTRTRNSRVFQEKSVKDILTELLKDYSSDSQWKVEATYPKLDYCVQHNETDFDFFSRLLEEFGIYYFFEHKDGKHTLVLIDVMGKHEKRKGAADIPWANTMKHTSTITTWYSQQEVRSIKTLLTEYDYLAPTATIEGKKEAEKKPEKLGTMEWFEHPAKVVQNSAKPTANPADTAATQQAKVRMEELLTLYQSATGQTNVRDIGTGMTFKVTGIPHDDDDGEYLMVAAVYRLDFGDFEAIDDLKTKRKHEGLLCDFLAIRKDGPAFRSPRITPKPVIAGPQTALVVGASGNEIETDEHGRIKVQFFWDRLGKKDQNSSCWVRVAQPWAGKGYGMFTLPRVGHEVVVHFLDGDPDRPLVTGSVYNKDNKIAWKLPDHSTLSGIKTQSSKEGGTDNKLANELRFEDAKGSEYIWFHAEKDFHRLVENDAFDWVGNNESVKVVMTRKEVIGENWFMDITNDVMHNMGKDLHVNVAGDIFFTGGATYQLQLEKDLSAKIGGDLGIEVTGKTQLKGSADIALESSTGKLSLKAGTGDLMAEGMTIKIKGATTVAIEGGVQVSLKAGGSFVDIGPSGVSITGAMVLINSGGAAGSAGSALSASPTAPTEAKKEDSITPEKKTDYNKTFDDPLPATEGGTGPAEE